MRTQIVAVVAAIAATTAVMAVGAQGAGSGGSRDFAIIVREAERAVETATNRADLVFALAKDGAVADKLKEAPRSPLAAYFAAEAEVLRHTVDYAEAARNAASGAPAARTSLILEERALSIAKEARSEARSRAESEIWAEIRKLNSLIAAAPSAEDSLLSPSPADDFAKQVNQITGTDIPTTERGRLEAKLKAAEAVRAFLEKTRL